MKASMLIVIPLLVFFSVWFPEIAHYHVKTVSIYTLPVDLSTLEHLSNGKLD